MAAVTVTQCTNGTCRFSWFPGLRRWMSLEGPFSCLPCPSALYPRSWYILNDAHGFLHPWIFLWILLMESLGGRLELGSWVQPTYFLVLAVLWGLEVTLPPPHVAPFFLGTHSCSSPPPVPLWPGHGDSHAVANLGLLHTLLGFPPLRPRLWK